jgi:hypothetical protein
MGFAALNPSYPRTMLKLFDTQRRNKLTTNRGWHMTRTSRSTRGVSGDDPADGAGVASRQTAVREVQRNRRPGLEALGGEALAAVPAAMPESERAGASRAQNRHGGAPRGERTDRKVRAAP